MLRCIRTGLIGVSLMVGIAACGGASSAGHAANSPAPPPTTSTAAALTAQQAKTLAAAAVLRAADMPGFKAKPATHDASQMRSEADEQRCLGLATQHFLARNFGTEFDQGELEVDSSADVVTSAAEGKRQLTAITGSKAIGCVRQTLASVVSASGGTMHAFSAKLVPVTLSDADGAFAYQLTVQATFSGQNVTIAGYEIGTLVGPVEVDLQATGPSPLALTLAQAERLVQTATTRERAAQKAAGVG